MASQIERREKIPFLLRWGTAIVAAVTMIASLFLYFAKWDALSHTLTLGLGAVYAVLAFAFTYLRYRNN